MNFYPVKKVNQTVCFYISQHPLDFSGKNSAKLHTARRLFAHISTEHCQVFIYTMSELGCHGANKNAQASKQQQRGFESRLSRLRFRHFTAAELLLVVLMREELRTSISFRVTIGSA